jgi:hypothetical protein
MWLKCPDVLIFAPYWPFGHKDLVSMSLCPYFAIFVYFVNF